MIKNKNMGFWAKEVSLDLSKRNKFTTGKELSSFIVTNSNNKGNYIKYVSSTDKINVRTNTNSGLSLNFPSYNYLLLLTLLFI